MLTAIQTLSQFVGSYVAVRNILSCWTLGYPCPWMVCTCNNSVWSVMLGFFDADVKYGWQVNLLNVELSSMLVRGIFCLCVALCLGFHSLRVVFKIATLVY